MDEVGIGSEEVKLYRVRTRLSRVLYDNSDCVINIVPPIDKVDVASAIETMKRTRASTWPEGEGQGDVSLHLQRPGDRECDKG